MGRRATLPPLTREQQARAASCYNRTRNVAFQFAKRRGRLFDIDQIESDAMLGLCQAARKFDPNRNNDFSAYSTTRIVGAMIDGVRDRCPLARSHHRKGFKPPEFEPLDVDVRDDNDEPVGFDFEQEDQVCWMLGGLRATEFQVMRRIYTKGASQVAVAREIGLSPGRVSQMHKMAMLSLRDRSAGRITPA